ncbi:MAG: hypothetical protein WC943_08035 [Elusimicrobiota bacterium]|jgi:hypothetical protein
MRLLLIEFFPGVLCRNEKSFLFPFMSGIARDHGGRPVWLCLGGALRVDDDPESGRTFRGVPSKEDLALLRRRLRQVKPTHIVSSELLSPSADRLIRSEAPGAEFLVMPTPQEVHASADLPAGCAMKRHAEVLSSKPGDRRFFPKAGWFLDWLEVSDPALEGSHLVEAEPDYGAEMLDEEARLSKAHLTIMSGVLCGNMRTLEGNPCFVGIGHEHDEHRGCAFCGSSMHPFSPPGIGVPAIVERQFRAILRTGTRGGRDKGVYEFYDIHAFKRFDEVFRVVLKLKVPPGVFLFNPRIDNVLAARKRIERVLPALSRAGHEVRILSMGIENFSEAENRRFNKDITPAQVDRLIELTRRWGLRHPRVFKPFKGGSDLPEFGLILYTPWTTLADLRVNLEAASARGFGGMGYWLYSTLLIYPDSPICSLARKEGGILTDRFPDRAAVFGAFSNEEESRAVVPWRFKDPAVADFFAIVSRVTAFAMEGATCPFFKGDPEFPVYGRLFAETAERVPATPLALACRLLEVMERREAGGGREGARVRKALLRQALDRLFLGPLAGPITAAEGEERRRFEAPVSAKALAVARLFRRLAKAKPHGLADLSVGSVSECPTPIGRAIRVSVAVAGRSLLLNLLDASAPGPFFLKSRRFKAILSQSTPSSGQAERSALEKLLELIDRSVGRSA